MRMKGTCTCRVEQRCRTSEVQSRIVLGCAHEHFLWVGFGDLLELHEADRQLNDAGDLHDDGIAHLSSVDVVHVQKSRN